MKARVYVTFKSTVLDPQGQTIQSALNGLGHRTITGVRQGKYFEIEIQPGTAKEDAAREMDQVARDVLANPVIEDYRVEFFD
jgi:phosphoribosylformylglycinamidine synthase PurS subunit